MEKPEEVFTFGSPWQEGNFSTKSEAELEPRIEDLATRFAGRITQHTMNVAFTGGANIEAGAELAAEEAGKIEEEKSQQLAASKHGLSQPVTPLDQLELVMHKAIPSFDGIELIDTE
ncbi:hypothetical protein HXX02_16245 [Microbulbifer elongatus]|uniref:Uncharacterized protein n=1 Tax=Microbulbifer elongatus TaxID=86173 RepID=A0ABT1P4F4_9GAMM|nr:YggN family protein [Microbulbifer elongatus]MCQ3830991.1 hypothetical protein [Microbulbifer elongatus]